VLGEEGNDWEQSKKRKRTIPQHVNKAKITKNVLQDIESILGYDPRRRSSRSRKYSNRSQVFLDCNILK
jgi:hypothetical protein